MFFACKKMKTIFVVFFLSVGVQSQEEEELTTLPPDEEPSTEDTPSTTTAGPPLSTTTLTPLRELDFRMTSTIGDFFVDVNFTEVRDDPSSVDMIVNINAEPGSEASRFLCQGLIGIYLLDLPDCIGLNLHVPQSARLLGTLNKERGTESALIDDLSISTLLSLNCLIVAADNSSYGQIFTSTSTTTLLPTTPSSTTSPTPTTFTSTPGPGEEDTTLPIQQDEVVESSLDSLARKFRQLGEQFGEDSFETAPNFSESNDRLDYYDPEDQGGDHDNLDAKELEQYPDTGDSQNDESFGFDDDNSGLDEGTSLDKRFLDFYRSSGCPDLQVFNKISLLGQPKSVYTRDFFLTSFAIVLSSGSVSSGSPAVVTSSSPGVVYFSDVGTFTYNPLANWPVVVLQGYYVLATYGAIILWALILGAIIWGVSISQFSGLFSVARRIGYVASELIYHPIERVTSMVYAGIEKFAELNRRNFRSRTRPRNNYDNAWKVDSYSYDY